jgi:hypothetical protein
MKRSLPSLPLDLLRQTVLGAVLSFHAMADGTAGPVRPGDAMNGHGILTHSQSGIVKTQASSGSQ